jgi:quercetin dioxygenase-like cupin family protein
MLPPGSSYENPRNGARLQILEMTPESLRFERLYKPRTGRADPHLHLDFTHSWEVLEGRCRYQLKGDAHDLGPGEAATINTGTPHRDLHNPFEQDARARFHITPCTTFVETFFETLVWLFERGKLDEQESFSQLQLFVILHATHAQSYAAGAPIWLQKAALPLLAAIGRRRGYQARYNQ